MEKLKNVFGDLYGHAKEKNKKSTPDIANDLRETASKTPTNWRNVFDAIAYKKDPAIIPSTTAIPKLIVAPVYVIM